MAFSPKIKEEVKYKSRYMCVFCKQFGLELDVHHIIPQSDGGSDDFDNAVCLCPNHHRQYGHEPEFIGKLREERDKWYTYCEKFLPDGEGIKTKFNDLESRMASVEKQAKEEGQKKIETMKKIMIDAYDNVIANLIDAKKKLEKEDLSFPDLALISVEASGSTATSGTVNAVAISSVDPEIKSSATYSPYSNLVECPICGSLFTQDHDVCPYCGQFYK